jgi:hypothetical protein
MALDAVGGRVQRIKDWVKLDAREPGKLQSAHVGEEDDKFTQPHPSAHIKTRNPANQGKKEKGNSHGNRQWRREKKETKKHKSEEYEFTEKAKKACEETRTPVARIYHHHHILLQCEAQTPHANCHLPLNQNYHFLCCCCLLFLLLHHLALLHRRRAISPLQDSKARVGRGEN